MKYCNNNKESNYLDEEELCLPTLYTVSRPKTQDALPESTSLSRTAPDLSKGLPKIIKPRATFPAILTLSNYDDL